MEESKEDAQLREELIADIMRSIDIIQKNAKESDAEEL
jgi:hypothetical protein